MLWFFANHDTPAARAYKTPGLPDRCFAFPRSMLLLFFGVTIGLSVGLSVWPGPAQAALSSSEEGAVRNYMATFETLNSDAADPADVFSDYLATAEDPFATIQFILSIGDSLPETMQVLVGNAIALYVQSQSIVDPQLSLRISQLVNEEASAKIVSGFTEEADAQTAQAGGGLNVPTSEPSSSKETSPN